MSSSKENITYRLRLAENMARETKTMAQELGLPDTCVSLLAGRGIRDTKQAKSFLTPHLKELPSPWLFSGMHDAVALIMKGLKDKNSFLIYGDYDVDGITATAILYDFLSKLEANVFYHLPDRLTEGYGLNIKTIDNICQKLEPGSIIITVDNGISAVKETDRIKELGYKLIITDHHEAPETLPAADVIINPKLEECQFPFSGLSGGGVVFFLIIALRASLREDGFWQDKDAPNLKSYLDLVALGTVADVMPMVEINRILTKAGLEVISNKLRIGIRALCEVANLREGRVNSGDIGYRLAPRINACGRLGSPEIALRLFLSKDWQEARTLAQELDNKNRERRKIEDEILIEAIELAQIEVEQGKAAIVVYKQGWHSGVIGIIASRLVDLFAKPTIVLTDDLIKEGQKIIKGSGRSIKSVNIYQGIRACKDVLTGFGGHPQAVGISLEKDNLEAFRNSFCIHIAKQLQGKQDKESFIEIDAFFDKDKPINPEITDFILQLEPFGLQNPEPVFVLKQQKLCKLRLINDKHFSFELNFHNQYYRGIAFNMKDKYELVKKKPVDLAFSFVHSVFRGNEQLGVRAVEIISSEQDK